METELWLLRSYAKNGKREEGLQLGEVLFAAATEAGEDDLAGQALLVLAELERADDPERCMQHLSQAVRLLDDDLECGTAQAQLADLLRSLGRNEEAAEAYLTEPDITSDTYIRFYAIVSAARTYGSMKRYEDALDLVEELLDDYSFAPHWNEIRFEVAEAKERLGWLDQALVDSEYIDTTAARTEFGTRSAIRRGWILEHSYGDYPGAQAAYARASAFTVAGVTPMAKQRENALSRRQMMKKSCRSEPSQGSDFVPAGASISLICRPPKRRGSSISKSPKACSSVKAKTASATRFSCFPNLFENLPKRFQRSPRKSANTTA